MNNKIIFFDEAGFQSDLQRINNLVDRINSQMDLLVKNDTITIEYLDKLLNNYDFIRKDKYREKLKEIADRFMIPYETINFPEHEQIIKSAKYTIQYLYEVRKKIGSPNKEFFRMNLLFLKDNRVFVSGDADNKLREKHTYYTETKSESKIIDDLLQMVDKFNELTNKKPFDVAKLIKYDNRNETYKLDISTFKILANKLEN